jgi:hypothetical protein
MENQNLLALDDCCHAILFPALEACSNLRGDQQYTELSRRLALFETLLWMDLGVGIGVFDVIPTRLLLREIQPTLNEQFGLLSEGLKAGFRETLLERISAIISGSERGGWFERKDNVALSCRFQIILGLVARLNSDIGATCTTAALSILPHWAWQSFIGAPLSADDLEGAVHGKLNPWIVGYAAIAKAGCFSLIEYLDGILNILRFDQIPEGVDVGRWLEFRRLISLVTSLRFDCEKPNVPQRFEDLLTVVGHTATLELRRYGLEVESDGWSMFARSLTQGWRGLSNPIGITATG